MLEIIKAVIFGIVQGITEWLPVSSTGHMILINEFMKLNVSQEYWQMFLVVIQFGSILAVVVLFWNKIFPFHFKEKPIIKKDIFMMWFKIIVACLPLIILVVFGLDEKCEQLFQNYLVVSIMLIVFGILFLIVEKQNKGRKPKITSISAISFRTAFIIGLFQLIAGIFPGTSRSGATIIGALIIGVSRTIAAEFTFFLAIPVMLGASLLKIVKFGFAFTGMEAAILITGMVVAFFVSIIVIRFLMNYIKKHDFTVFGWYRIVLGVIVLLYFMVLA